MELEFESWKLEQHAKVMLCKSEFPLRLRPSPLEFVLRSRNLKRAISERRGSPGRIPKTVGSCTCVTILD